jgi:hypothetical protein
LPLVELGADPEEAADLRVARGNQFPNSLPAGFGGLKGAPMRRRQVVCPQQSPGFDRPH